MLTILAHMSSPYLGRMMALMDSMRAVLGIACCTIGYVGHIVSAIVDMSVADE
jgi:hypothetical protein